MANPNINRTRGGKANRPSQSRHADLGHVYREEQIKPTWIRGAGREVSTIRHGSSTAAVCDTPPQHEKAGDYNAVYSDRGRVVHEVVRRDNSLTRKLGLRWRPPMVETQDRRWKQFDDVSGRFVEGSDPSATFVGPTTLLLPGNPFPSGQPSNLKWQAPRSEVIRPDSPEAVDRPEPRISRKAWLANRQAEQG